MGKQGVFSARQNVDCDEGSGEARRGTHCERPTRTKVVGNPTSDWSADWRSSECHANP